MKYKKLLMGMVGMFLMVQFSGCAFPKFFTKRQEMKVQVLLALPFYCENYQVAEEITKNFKETLNKKTEVVDLKGFDSYLSSHPIRMPEYFPDSVKKSSGAASFSSPKNITVSTSSAMGSSLFEKLINDLFEKEEVREKFYRESGIDYIVIGKAKEKELTELEYGNLVTAETAEMKLLELRTGEILLDESFKQGVFEIVAPDRIGKKMASKVNGKLNQIRKEEKRAVKRREQTEKDSDSY